MPLLQGIDLAKVYDSRTDRGAACLPLVDGIFPAGSFSYAYTRARRESVRKKSNRREKRRPREAGEQPRDQFYHHIPGRDRLLAITAFSAEQKITEDRNQIFRKQPVIAVRAMRKPFYKVEVSRQPVDKDVQEGTDDRPYRKDKYV